MVIYASILTGKPISCENGIVTIEYSEEYKFNRDRLNKQENKTIVNEVLSEFFNDNIKVNFVVIDANSNEKSAEELLKDTLGEEFIEVLDEEHDNIIKELCGHLPNLENDENLKPRRR